MLGVFLEQRNVLARCYPLRKTTPFDNEIVKRRKNLVDCTFGYSESICVLRILKAVVAVKCSLLGNKLTIEHVNY